jgi:CIC family chloride channel protein
MLNSGWFEDVLTWRKKHLSDRQFTLVLAFLVGIFAALAAFVLHGLIHVIQHLLTQEMELTSFNWLFLILPVVVYGLRCSSCAMW